MREGLLKKKMGRKTDNNNKPKETRAHKAQIVFPVGRVEKILRGKQKNHVSAGAPVVLSAVLEYLTAEVLEMAGQAAMDNKRTRITPRHLALVLQQDDEYKRIFAPESVVGGGSRQNIRAELLPASRKAKKVVDEAAEAVEKEVKQKKKSSKGKKKKSASNSILSTLNSLPVGEEQ